MHHFPSILHFQQQLLRRDFHVFLAKVFQTVCPGQLFLPNWHLDAIAAHLHACQTGEMNRLIINMPPRMMKSLVTSVAWPAWLLGQDPTSRIMVASYAQSLSIKHSLDCRLVMQAPWYRRAFPLTQLAHDQNEKHKYTTTKRGHRIAVSVGGAATGEGGNILIVDDPLNPLQAMQRSAREAANDWFRHTFVSRLDDKQRGAIVVVMQRLHTDDLTGMLLQAEGWKILSLPAVALQDTTLTCGNFTYARKRGEALHAAREPLKLLQRTKLELGSTNFAAQYQQAPQSVHGNMVPLRWFRRFDLGEYV